MSDNISCPHNDAEILKKVCSHILSSKNERSGYIKSFTGIGIEYDLVCRQCAEKPADINDNLQAVCIKCFAELEEKGYWEDLIGLPQILERQTNLCFKHRTIAIPELTSESILEIKPVESSTESLWIALTASHKLFTLNLSDNSVQLMFDLSEADFDFKSYISLYISNDARFAAIANDFAENGIVVDLVNKKLTMFLERGDYCSYTTAFPVAFSYLDGRHLLIHGTDWNRLDISDPQTGELLTEREPSSYQHGEERPEHYLDYFHARLLVSPNQEWIADNGWVWHPIGIIDVWNIKRWLNENIWESEDGSSKRSLCWRDYYWDGPLCWIDDKTLAIWGYGTDDENLIPAVRIFNVESGEEIKCFFGPNVELKDKKTPFHAPYNGLKFDKYLFALSEQNGTAVWDVETGERLLQESNFCPKEYHHGAREFLTIVSDGHFQLSRLVENDNG